MKKQYIPFEKVKARAMKNPAFKKAYDGLEEKYALIEAMITLRNKVRLSQEELAKRMGTTQSVIARIESGNALPSMKTLLRYAHAAGMRPVLSFKPV